MQREDEKEKQLAEVWEDIQTMRAVAKASAAEFRKLIKEKEKEEEATRIANEIRAGKMQVPGGPPLKIVGRRQPN